MDAYQSGRITDIQPKQTKEGTPYRSLKIDGHHFTCWDPDLFDDLQEGVTVEYRWKPSGRFKRITEFHRSDVPHRAFSPTDRRITRMNALRTAAMLYAHDPPESHDKTLATLSTAMFFELYLLDEEPLGSLSRDYHARIVDTFHHPVDTSLGPASPDANQSSPNPSRSESFHQDLADRILTDELDRLTSWLYE